MRNKKTQEFSFIKPDDPNTKILCTTTDYVTLNEKWKAYLKIENAKKQKGEYFIDFCVFYLSILKSELAIKLAPKVSIELMKEGAKFHESYQIFTKCIETLIQAMDHFHFSKLEDYLLNFFYSYLKCLYKFNIMIPQSTLLFESIFSKRDIAGDLGSSSFFEKCIPEYFCKNQSIIVSQYLQLLISNQVDNRFYETINPRKSMKSIISIMNDSSLQELMKPQVALLFCTFYQRISKIVKNFSTFVHDNNGLKSLELIITTENRPYFYSMLIMTNNDDKSQPPNSKNLNYTYQYFLNNPEEQNFLFEMIFTLIQTDSSLFDKINSVVPIKKWFESTKINLKSALMLTTTAYKKIPDDFPFILPHFFKLLDRDKDCIEAGTYLKCFNLIDNLFAKRLVSLKNLDSLNFLQLFVLNPKSSQLAEFFTKAPTFAQLTLDIFAYNQNFEIRPQVFNSILILHQYFEKVEMFISLCSAFLIIAPTRNNSIKLMKEIESTGKYYLVMIFAVSFPKSVELTDNFIHLNLHKWISDLFDKSLITIDVLSNLFASLVVQKPYRELNNLIDSFDKSHPIFSLDKNQIDRIVYGWKESDVYPHRPIRVSSLFHLLDCPERCSPYNAWVIGKFCLSNFEDFEKVPLLPCVANRFMHAENVERALKYPKMFEQFCDLSYDHFSMFQFYDGNEEMIIDFNFTTISFWFIFSEELLVDVPIFHTDNLFFYLNNTSLTVICNGQTIVVDATPTQWTHVFIRLESSLISQIIKITLNNENTFSFQLKTKIPEFTNASFSAAIGSPMMFLGSAIRLSSISPKDFSMIYKNGPGYIEPSIELEESLLVTPFALSNVKIPLNCFPVPYMGFPLHNLSNHNLKIMLRHLRETDDRETYNIVFRAICNINKLTNNYNKKFWKQFLESIKHAKFFPSADLLKSALSTVVTPNKSEKIFQTIIYGNDLWDMIDNEALICTLFDSFPTINWKSFPDADIFLAKIVEKNPTNSTIINKIFINWKKVPKTLKLIIDLLKSAPITDWNSTQMKFRPESPLQFTILECILNIINKKNHEVFKPYFPFDELRYMFVTASPKLAVQIFHLITVFAAFIVDFIQLDSSFLCKVASLCNFASIWNDSMFLVTGDPDCTNQMILRPSLIPILLHLIWSGSSLIIHSLKNKIDNEKIKTLLDKTIGFITPLIPQIIGQQDCGNIFLTYFPIILHYESIFDPNFAFNTIQSPMKIPQLSVTNLSENDDPIWTDLISMRQKSAQSFPNPPQVPSSKLLLYSIISEFISLTNNDEEISENNEIALPSSIIDLLSDLVLNSGQNAIQMALSLFIWYPYDDASKSQPFVKDLIHVILQRCDLPLLSLALSVTLFFSKKHYLSDDSARIYNDLFILSNKSLQSFGKDGLAKYMLTIMKIFFEIFSKVPNEDYVHLFKVIKRNIHIFSQMALQTKMLKSWIYGFSIAFKDLDGLFEIIFLFYRLQYQEEKKETDEEEPPQLTDDIINGYQSEWEQQVSNTGNEPEVNKDIPNSSLKTISEASFEFTKKTYIANCKHFLVRSLLNDSFLFIDSSFPIFIEKYKWSNFVFLQQLMRQSQSNFNPKCFHLSPRCEPFYTPKILAPSPFPYFEGDFTKSPIVDLFNNNFNVEKPLKYKRTLLSLFYEKFAKLGNPISVAECNFCRYTSQIQAVSFWFSQTIVILMNAKINRNDIQFVDDDLIDPKEKHIFIESVILGHFGKTSLFCSHVVTIVPFYSVLFTLNYSQTKLAFWTFNSGHFILELTPALCKQVAPYLDKINKIAIDSYPLENYLTQAKTTTQAFTMWKNKKISAAQFIYAINSLSKRSFVDLENFPFIPQITNLKDSIDKKEFYDGKTVSSLLSRILPFHYFAEDKCQLDISKCQNFPANLLTLPELLTDINHFGIGDANISNLARTPRHLSAILRTSLEDPNNNNELMKWARSHFDFKLSRSLSLDPRMMNNKNDFDESPKKTNQTQAQNQNQNPKQAVPQMKNLLERQKTTVISISRRLSRLTFVNNLTDKVLFRRTHPLYGLAGSISASIDGVFFVIDFAFGITRAYKVIFSGGNPVQAKCISTFSIGSRPISSISGYDWICASASSNRLALWEIITGTVHRLIDFDSLITALSFNESGYYIWVAVSNKIEIVGVNGNILSEKVIEDDVITAITHINRTHNAFCGTKKGKLFMLHFDLASGEINLKELNSLHSNPIEKIIVQRTIRQYLTLDSTGMIEKYDNDGNLINGESPIFTACAICTNPTHELCQFCNKPICKKCMPNHLKGPNCRHVTAFI